MSSRKTPFVAGEHYHCFNRGVDKRIIFEDQQDYIYFLKLLRFLNTKEVLGKLRLHEKQKPIEPTVTILSYNLLPNHFHLLLRSNIDGGISKYMQRVSGGYTMYFNKKYKRSGVLFQGKFKDTYIETDQDLRQVLGYVYFNNLIHNIKDEKLYRNSLNTKDNLVRGLSSNLEDLKSNLKQVAEIIIEKRLALE